jgi:3-oxoacyl-[acyl-carrier-protein] synthase II
VQYVIAALEQVMKESGLVIDGSNAYDVGAFIGSGMGGIRSYTDELRTFWEKGPRRVSPFLIPSITVDAGSMHVAMRTGAQGPNFGIGSACASGADNLGQAFEIIRRGHAQAMFAGGFEAGITPIAVASFSRMRALSQRNNEPERASRPFDAGRDGFVLSEGGALLLLEELESALDRGAEPMAELLAYAGTSDALHLTNPDPEGVTSAKCITLAMERSGIEVGQVDYINAHGTGTPAGDLAETAAIKLALGEYAYRIPVSSTKSMTGHLTGGGASLEAAICVQALRTGVVPPTINLEIPDPACDLDYVSEGARRVELKVVLSNSFGFGGRNVTLVLRTCR